MQLTSHEIDLTIKLVEDLCGIYLDESKSYLLETRLDPVVQEFHCENFAELADLAGRQDQENVRDSIIDAITTNETLFFRDKSPFEALKYKLLPELIDRVELGTRPRSIRIWSAACSTGQEPYSLAMTLCDLIPDIDHWDINILGTDISNSAIEQARQGLYSELEIGRGLEESYLSRYFEKEGKSWRINPGIRRMVQLETRNLLHPFLEKDYFDFVMCRNVAIYFKKSERDDVFRRIVGTIATGGSLFVGSSESLFDLGPEFSPETHCNCTVYRPKQNIDKLCHPS